MSRVPETDVLALGVEEEVAGGPWRAVDLVAAEGDPGAGALAHVAEDHLLHVDGGAPLVGDAVDAAVLDRPRPVPGAEDRGDRAQQLLARLLGQLFAGLLGEDPLEVGDQAAQVGGLQLGVERDAALGLDRLDRLLEQHRVDPADDVAEHLHEAAVGVPGEALVAGLGGEAADGGRRRGRG